MEELKERFSRLFSLAANKHVTLERMLNVVNGVQGGVGTDLGILSSVVTQTQHFERSLFYEKFLHGLTLNTSFMSPSNQIIFIN